MKEQVNHPQHYNSHPNGIECIDIIRHYTCDIANAIKYLWRAGLKPEMGKDDADKEIEDLKKALWYIEDYKANCTSTPSTLVCNDRIGAIFHELTEHTRHEVIHGYEDCVGLAMFGLMSVGIIWNGKIRSVNTETEHLREASNYIQQRILDIEVQLTNHELQSTIDVLHGKAVDGEDYVSKPGGVRDTEPDKYDPLNIIIINATAYCLTDEKREKPNGALYSPCDNCDLRQECLSADGSEQMKSLCHLHQATDQEYYREVGYCKYAPSFGTIEVVDELKESEKELRELEEND